MFLIMNYWEIKNASWLTGNHSTSPLVLHIPLARVFFFQNSFVCDTFRGFHNLTQSQFLSHNLLIAFLKTKKIIPLTYQNVIIFAYLNKRGLFIFNSTVQIFQAKNHLCCFNQDPFYLSPCFVPEYSIFNRALIRRNMPPTLEYLIWT